MMPNNFFCENCFNESNIKKYIVKNGKSFLNEDRKCPICSSYTFSIIIEYNKLIKILEKALHNLYQFDEEYTYDYLSNIAVKNYCEGDESPELYANLVSINTYEGVQNKPDFFYENIESIFTNTFKFENDVYKLYQIFEMNSNYTESCVLGRKIWKYKCLYSSEENRLGEWKYFCENVKYKARYFNHNEFNVINYLKKFNSFFKMITIFDYNKSIFRARVIDSEKIEKQIKNGNKTKELGKTPKEFAKNNRFSPVGISYGYFSFDEQTILDEVRVNINDKVAIGHFKLQDNLKILDFRKSNLARYKIPYNNDFNFNVYCEEKFFVSFINDISKPILDQDSTLEYIPTQILSEYIWSIGYDGFIYDSSLRVNGENIVLFGDNPQCLKSRIFQIISKKIDYKIE